MTSNGNAGHGNATPATEPEPADDSGTEPEATGKRRRRGSAPEADAATTTPFKFQWQRAFMRSDLPPITRHVLHVLCAYMNPNGGDCYPSIDLIRNSTGLCDKAVRLHLQTAVEAGWLKRWERRAGGATLAGRAAQGWRHYNYFPLIPPNVRYDIPDVHNETCGISFPKTPETCGISFPNVRYDIPLTKQRPTKLKEPERERARETQRPRSDASGARASLSLIPAIELPASTDALDEWLNEGHPEGKYLEWFDTAMQWLDERGNIIADDESFQSELVNLDDEYHRFRAHWLDRLEKGDQRAHKTREGWHRAFCTVWIPDAWKFLERTESGRKRIEENRKANEAQQRRQAEAAKSTEERRRRQEADDAEKQARQQRLAEGRTCQHCAHRGDILKKDAYHCQAGQGRQSPLGLLNDGDVRYQSVVHLDTNKHCEAWQARGDAG